MTNLNTEYSQSVLNGARNFWEAIPHVLIAGTDPSLLRLYLGCWAGELTPDGVADALEPDGSGWDFEWTWHTLLDMPTSVSSYLPALQALPAFLAGGGDFVVEKTSALADSVTGDIRRAEFAVNHFSLICEDKIVTSYGPYGPHGRHGLPLPLKLRPWQVIFWELGLPLSTVSGCDPQKNPCD